MGFWDWLGGKKARSKAGGGIHAAAAAVGFLPAEQSPFGVRTLDLRPFTHTMISTTTDAANAERAISWSLAEADAIPPLELGEGARAIPCALAYAVAPSFPDGLLFAPRAMEEKWALFHRAGSLVAVRSWTGKVAAVGRGTKLGDRLVIEELSVAEGGLGPFDDSPAVFDWLVRTHALGQTLPLPLSNSELEMAQRTPVLVFSVFGRMAAFAAHGFSAPESPRPLRAFAPLVQSVRKGDAARARALLERGADPDVPSPLEGYTALHLAMVNGNVEILRALLAHGANVKCRTDRGMDAVGLGIVSKASVAVLAEVVAAGASLDAVNLDGFGLLHAAAEVNRPEVVAWLASRGLDLELRTLSELSPLHVACGLGHLDAARALVAAGADAEAPSPLGTPRQIAEKEGHAALAALLSPGSG